MRRAIELAQLGRYTNHPNPRVGCVIAQGERIVGEGWHRKWGEPHAEVHALREAGDAARGATAYVTLEPHSYQGRTPPCTDALIRAGVARVVCGALDPNPKVLGQGVRQLEAAGVIVQTGLLEDQVRELNPGFEKRMTLGSPRVIVKLAASLDGRTALANGASRWITGEAARADVQRLRAEAGAVLTGVETVLADDPLLNVRDPQIELLGRQPLRVILDTRLRTPPGARILSAGGETLIFTTHADGAARRALEAAGARVIEAPPDENGRVNLGRVLRVLAENQCNDVLVEAGPTLSGAVLDQGFADELIVYFAPMLLGPQARAMANLAMIERLEDARRYALMAVDRLDADVRLRLKRIEAIRGQGSSD
ncbi:MAG TPA: bifunctional diaminohydroxyphosphoribosylaminopyrimidine deaminase/5-amino-6-(5-phosphoribosylamino)uracil reductase RibD [Steroidobacter sp.]|nr:bifunctional diaminohydroxyphosphoribosylaminopyrimidine deaminase/5-amino-6-(5-phosphoribosylamino)uracil reductase RibD [Steroidobacteraceae bacterium]HLS80848.1 bifunctional diaminohydroxyphosphoribosylaminopyrimidine deaminase/5-amino-6-(5-phosphoribosylamino)uracil reductase RibD [Steroidobacter sp.]